MALVAHSVASGDPYDHSILLWTRAVGVQTAAVDVPICVTYEVFSGLNGTVSAACASTYRKLLGLCLPFLPTVQRRLSRIRSHLLRH